MCDHTGSKRPRLYDETAVSEDEEQERTMYDFYFRSRDGAETTIQRPEGVPYVFCRYDMLSDQDDDTYYNALLSTIWSGDMTLSLWWLRKAANWRHIDKI